MRYVELAQELRSRIASGVYPNGGCLESEAELCRDCGVSRTTVRKALELLRRDGLVASRKGSGWFVALRPQHQAPGSFPNPEQAIRASGATPSRQVLEYAFEPAPRAVGATLALGRGAEVLRVTMLISADATPFALHSIWMAAELGNPISRSAFAESPTVELFAANGLSLGGGSQVITAGLASRFLSPLGVRRGAAVLICRGVVLDAEDRPVFVYEDHYRGDRMAFDVEFGHLGGRRTDGSAIDIGLHLAGPD